MITFYATVSAGDERSYMPGVPVLLPASSWARPRFAMRAPRLPAHVTDRAADCGGFVATNIWGDYRYTPTQYVAWLETFRPAWAATMDYCCEPEVAGAGVRDRQERTTAMARRFWSEFRDCPWAWAPTVQGWDIDDYRRHAGEIAPTIGEMQAHYGPASAFRVGIGTLCQRADGRMIRTVARAVAAELPGVPLHLWGVKLAALGGQEALPEQVVSVDSAAWNGRWGADCEAARRAGMTQRRYGYTVALPAYIAKVQAAVAGPKQGVLF